jgi:hypothetical protein
MLSVSTLTMEKVPRKLTIPVEFIINHAELSVIFTSAAHLPILLKLAPSCPCLKLIVSIDELSVEAKNLATTWGQAQGVQIRELRDSQCLAILRNSEDTKLNETL